MLRNLVLAFALVLSPTAIAHADVPASSQSAQSADEAFGGWLMPVVGALERAGQATLPFMQIDFNFSDQQAAGVAIRQMASQAATARPALASIRAEIDAMAPFAHPQATGEQVSLSNVILRDSRQTLTNMDNMLADIMAFAEAYQRRDARAMNEVLPRLENSARILIRSQATMIRARQPLAPRSSSQYHAIGGMAAMYEGMATLLESDANFDLPALEAAERNMTASLASERAALAVERAGIPPGPYRPVMVQIMDSKDQFSSVNERARDILRAAIEDARAGRASDTTRLANLEALGHLEYEYQAISRRQIELFGQLSN